MEIDWGNITEMLIGVVFGGIITTVVSFILLEKQLKTENNRQILLENKIALKFIIETFGIKVLSLNKIVDKLVQNNRFGAIRCLNKLKEDRKQNFDEIRALTITDLLFSNYSSRIVNGLEKTKKLIIEIYQYNTIIESHNTEKEEWEKAKLILIKKTTEHSLFYKNYIQEMKNEYKLIK